MPSRGKTGSGPLGIDVSSQKDIAKMLRDLRKIEPAVAKATRARFKRAAKPVLEDAKRRQPKLTGELRRKTKIRFTRGRVEIRSSARHARISEFGGRHPVYGNREVWVKQEPAPAIFPAVAAGRSEFVKQAEAAVYVAAKEAGWR
jgi:bacteriophage HK97-gp10 putative tail-component